jgi:putative sugar O-methyltransferase
MALLAGLTHRHKDAPTVLHAASECAALSGDLDLAEKWALRAFELAPGSHVMARQAAEILVKQDQFGPAIHCLEQVLASSEDAELPTLTMLGRLLHFVGKHADAVAVYRRAVAIAPDRDDLYEDLWRVHNSMGRPDLGDEWRRRKPQPPAPPGLGDMVGSEEVSGMTDAEYAQACGCLDAVEAMMASRHTLPKGHVGQPSGQWGDAGNPSVTLLRSRDCDVLRKMRFYAQDFHGSRLPFFDPARGRPKIDVKLPDNYDQWMRWFAPEAREIHAAVRYMNAQSPGTAIASPPKFGEIGWRYGDGILNMDTVFTQVHVANLHAFGLLGALGDKSAGRTVTVVEIGGGYGALAYRLLRLVPNVRMIIVDLPESLAFSSIYLTTLFPGLDCEFVDAGGSVTLGRPGISFVSNAAFGPGLVPSGAVDLAINTMSMAEMSDLQIEDYGAGLALALDEDGVFFECNHPWEGGLIMSGESWGPFSPARKPVLARRAVISFPGLDICGGGHVETMRRPGSAPFMTEARPRRYAYDGISGRGG